MPPGNKKNSHIVISENQYLLLILGSAIILRLIFFMGVLRGDAVNYMYQGYLLYRNGLGGYAEVTRHIIGSNRPGLYIPVALLFAVFGVSEFTAILFPLVASVFTCFFLYRFARALGGNKAGLLAAFLWAVFPLDVFMATQLDPEAPLAMTTAGAIYFLVSGSSKVSRVQKLTLFLLSGAFILWAFSIKASSMPIIFVAAAWLCYKYWPSQTIWSSLFKRINPHVRNIAVVFGLGILVVLIGLFLAIQPWPLVINSAELSAYDIAPAWILGRENTVQMDDLGGRYSSITRNLYNPPAQTKALTEYPLNHRFSALDAYVPLFLIAAITIIFLRKRNYYFPLLWFGILFFYLEWGVYPSRLRFPEFFYYFPISHWISLDNLLYLCVPMVLVFALYISDNIEKQRIGSVILLAVAATLTGVFFLKIPLTREIALNYIDLAQTLILILVAFAAFISVDSRSTKLRNLVFPVLVIIVGMATLKPSQHYHVFDFYKEQERRANLMALNDFLEDQPEYPIYALRGPIALLDAYSGFKYGYSTRTRDYRNPGSRLKRDWEVIQEDGGYSINFGCQEPAVSYDNWPFAEFGNPNSAECISLYRYLPELGIGEVASARNLALTEFTSIAFDQYIAVSANTKQLPAFIEAISLMTTHFPEDTPIVEASGIVRTYGGELETNREVDLLGAYSDEEAKWEFGGLLKPRVQSLDGQDVLRIRIDGATQLVQPISLRVTLKSNTAYILNLEILSTAAFDLVRFPEDNIPDSYLDSWNRDLSWRQYSIVFVTPVFKDEQKDVLVELARIYDKGEIQFREIGLMEVVPND